MTTGPGVPEELVPVELKRVPLRLYERAAQHQAELMREFSLITLSEHPSALPGRLLRLIEDLQDRFGEVSAGPDAERDAAVAEGRASIDLVYAVPRSAGPASRELLELLHEADVYCSGDRLMTLPSPPDQVAFVGWYLGEFVRQTNGEPARPWGGSLD